MKSSVVLCLMLLVSGNAVLRAQDNPPRMALSKTSLALVPKDVAFYQSLYQPREMWLNFLQSNPIKELRSVPYVQSLEAEWEKQWSDPSGQLKDIKRVSKDPLVKSIIKVVEDMLSTELFYYGGSEWIEFIAVLQELNEEMTIAAEEGPESLQEFMSVNAFQYIERLKVPRAVFGCKVKNTEALKAQLYATEALIRFQFGQSPELKPLLRRLKSTEKNGIQMLFLALDATLIPMDSVDAALQPLVQQVVEALGKRVLTITLAVKEQYFYATIGEGAPFIDSIGEGETLLEHERLKTLVDRAPDNLRSVSYQSGQWRNGVWETNFGSYFERITSQFSGSLAAAFEESPEIDQWRNDLLEDARSLDAIIADWVPEYDVALSWTTADTDGLHGMAYDWTHNAFLQNAQPLSILSNAGQSPLMLYAMKRKPQPAMRDFVKLLLQVAPGHAKKFIEVVEEDEAERDRIIDIVDSSIPILEEMSTIVFEELLPSMDERESLFVLASNWTASRPFAGAPVAENPLPLPEAGIVFKLRNRDQFLAGCQSLYNVLDQVVDLIRKYDPDAMPGSNSLPRPERESLANGDRFAYPQFNGFVPVAGFKPQIFVNKDLVILSYTDRQVSDLAEAKPLALHASSLLDNKPLAVAGYANASALVRAIGPWIEYAVQQSENFGDSFPIGDFPAPTSGDVKAIWNCLTHVGVFESKTHTDESGVTVTRWNWIAE